MAKELKDLTKSDENYSQWYNDWSWKGRAGRKLAGPYGHHQTLRLRHLGEDAGRAGPDVQGDGASERLASLSVPNLLFLEVRPTSCRGGCECAVVTHYRSFWADAIWRTHDRTGAPLRHA